MTSPVRLRRQARDRAISITLAIVIGLVVGVGGWVLWHNRVLTSPPSESSPPANAAAVTLLPHKALYGVSMVSARNGSQIIDIEGKMFYQMHQGCETYITDHRFVLNYDYADSEPLHVTSDFSTVESQDGQKFDFSSRRRRDGELYQELRGKAEIQAEKGGQAVFVQPPDLIFDFDHKTMFPSAHTRALILAARTGQKFVAARVFDGSDDQGPVDVTAVIGQKVEILSTLPVTPALETAPLKTPAWRIHMAFFPTGTQTETPEYELTMVLQENGVISDMSIDYADFSVHQRLLALESLPPEACGAPLPTPQQAPARTDEKPTDKDKENPVIQPRPFR